ncbi:MAG: hypothetical protein E6Z52_00040 [Staphylococcus sp.]|nr:hypothetical protein [Staphylococcus sp.]
MKEQQKKYELTGEFIEHWSGKKLYRIRALVSFGVVVTGQLGGFVESEKNLDQSLSGNAWVYGDARVYGNAEVYGNARVYGNAEVYGDARVSGDAEVYGDARVYGNAEVYGDARVYGDAEVYGDARVRSYAVIYERKMIFWASNVGSENGTLTVFNGKDGLIVTRGCFTGAVDEFLAKSAEVHDDKTKNEYKLLIEVAKSRILGVKDE